MKTSTLYTLLTVLLLHWSPVSAERIKDLASIESMRDNQLIGYGLVVGLDGTGDQVSQVGYTAQSLKSMLAQLGIVVPPGVTPQPKNVAAVMLHATLPAFAKKGQQIDVTASSVGNAKSLRGGTLLMSPLKGIDGSVYAIAQGNLVVGGLGVQGADGSSVTVNVPSVGRIPNGAIIERTLDQQLAGRDGFILNLHTPDFTTVSRMADVINEEFGGGTAKPLDPTSIQVKAPFDQSYTVGFLSMVENLEMQPGDAPAKVIVNSRTGTVVISSHVRVQPAAVSHGSLVVTISENTAVSQPAPFSRTGNTEVIGKSDIWIDKLGDDHMFLFEPGIDLNEIVRAVNQVGAAPGDLVAILEALKEAGALRARLIVI